MCHTSALSFSMPWFHQIHAQCVPTLINKTSHHPCRSYGWPGAQRASTGRLDCFFHHPTTQESNNAMLYGMYVRKKSVHPFLASNRMQYRCSALFCFIRIYREEPVLALRVTPGVSLPVPASISLHQRGQGHCRASVFRGGEAIVREWG